MYCCTSSILYICIAGYLLKHGGSPDGSRLGVGDLDLEGESLRLGE